MEFETNINYTGVEDPEVDERDRKNDMELNTVINVEPKSTNDEYPETDAIERDAHNSIAGTPLTLEQHSNDACQCKIEIKIEIESSGTESNRSDVAQCILKTVTTPEQPSEPCGQNLINVKVERGSDPLATVEPRVQSGPFKCPELSVPDIPMTMEKSCNKSVPQSWMELKAESTSGPKNWAELKAESASSEKSSKTESTQNKIAIKVESVPPSDESSKIHSNGNDAASIVLNTAPPILDTPSTIEGPFIRHKIMAEVKIESGLVSDEPLKIPLAKLGPAEKDVIIQVTTGEEEVIKETKECFTKLPEAVGKSEKIFAQYSNIQLTTDEAVAKAKERIRELATSAQPSENAPRHPKCTHSPDQLKKMTQRTEQVENDSYIHVRATDPPHPKCKSSFPELISMAKSVGVKGEKRGTFFIEAYHRGKDPYKLLSQLSQDDTPPWCGYVRGNHSRSSKYAMLDKRFPHPKCKFTLPELKTMAEQIPESFGIETRMKFIHRCYANGKDPSSEDWTQYSINPFYEFEDLPPHRNCHHSIDELKLMSEQIPKSCGSEARVQFVLRCYRFGKNPNTEDVTLYKSNCKKLIINNPFKVKNLEGVELSEFEGHPHPKCKYSLDKIKDLAAQIPESLGSETRVHFIRRCYRYGHNPMKEDWTKYFQPTPIRPPVNKDEPYVEFDSVLPSRNGSYSLEEIKRIAERIPESFGVEARVKFIRRCYRGGKDPTTEDWTQYNVDPYFEIQDRPVHRNNKFSFEGLKKMAERIPESVGIWHRIHFVRRCYQQGKNPHKEDWTKYNINTVPIQPDDQKTFRAFNIPPNNTGNPSLRKSHDFSAKATTHQFQESLSTVNDDPVNLRNPQAVPGNTPLLDNRSLEELKSLAEQIGARIRIISNLNKFQKHSANSACDFPRLGNLGPQNNHNPHAHLGDIGNHSLDELNSMALRIGTQISKFSEVENMDMTPLNDFNRYDGSSRLGGTSAENLDHPHKRINMYAQENPHPSTTQVTDEPLFQEQAHRNVSPTKTNLNGFLKFIRKFKRNPECKLTIKALKCMALSLPTNKAMKRFMFLTYSQGKDPFKTLEVCRRSLPNSIPSNSGMQNPSVGFVSGNLSSLGPWQKNKTSFSGGSNNTGNSCSGAKDACNFTSVSAGGLTLNNPPNALPPGDHPFNLPSAPLQSVVGVMSTANSSPFGRSLIAPLQFFGGFPNYCSPDPIPVGIPMNSAVITPPASLTPRIPSTGLPSVPQPTSQRYMKIVNSPNRTTAITVNQTDSYKLEQPEIQQDFNPGTSSTLKRKMPYQEPTPSKRPKLVEEPPIIENHASEDTIDPLFIVPSGYPNVRLSEEQMDTIENGILEAILDIDDGAKPAFKESVRSNGRFGFVCNDDFTKKFICKFLKTHQPWPNASLRIISDESKVRANAVLPLCKDDDEKIMKFIGKQNAGLNVWDWKIVERWDRSDSKTCMNLMVDEDSAKVLQICSRINFKLTCGQIVIAQKEIGCSGPEDVKVPNAFVASRNHIEQQDKTKVPFRASEVAHDSRQRQLPEEQQPQKPVQSSPSFEKDRRDGKTGDTRLASPVYSLYDSISSDEDRSRQKRAISRSSSRHIHSKNHRKRACSKKRPISKSSSSSRRNHSKNDRKQVSPRKLRSSRSSSSGRHDHFNDGRNRSSRDRNKSKRPPSELSVYDEDRHVQPSRSSLQSSRKGLTKDPDRVQRHSKPPSTHTMLCSSRPSPDAYQRSSDELMISLEGKLESGSSRIVTSKEYIGQSQARTQPLSSDSGRSEGECTPSPPLIPPKTSLRSRLQFFTNQEVARSSRFR